MSAGRNRLEIRVEPHYFDASEVTNPVATILIDGEELFAHVPPSGFTAWDPDDLLVPDSPLEPADLPRRVAVYRCSCGEPGCGVVAPMITRESDEVRWTDFQDFTGWFSSPVHDPEDEPEDGRPLPIPDLKFDYGQYMAEIRRATADRSWETPIRQTARHLKELLAAQQETLIEWGLEIDWVFPAHRRENSVTVCLRDSNHRYVQPPWGQVMATVTAPDGSPHDRASQMLTALLSTSPEQWEHVFPWEYSDTD